MDVSEKAIFRQKRHRERCLCTQLAFLQGLDQFRHSREQVRLQPVVRHAEDRRFGSLLIATITFESFIPAKCWIAPEMPAAAMYSCGATILPVWPTCKSLGA